MKAILIPSLAILLLVSTIALAAPTKVTLEANNMPIREAADSISKQTGALILLDGDVMGRVTASLTGVEADRAVEMVAKSCKLDWKKVELVVGTEPKAPADPKAMPDPKATPEPKVTTERLKAAITALAALDIPGMSLADPASGKVAIVAKGLAKDAATQVKLPDGQRWQTYYLISKPAAAKPEQTAAKAGAKNNDQKEAAERAQKIMAMSPEERQQLFQNEFNVEMQLPQEARAQIWRDRMAAFGNVMRDPVNGPQFREELRSAFRSMRPEGAHPQEGQE